jgi:hypothetical protein
MPRTHPAAVRLPRWLLLVLSVLAVSWPVVSEARSTDTADISSAWRVQPIRIDGNDEDWYGLTSPVKGQRFAIGLLNDSEAIYLCLVTKDRVLTTQIERQGLMVWLDPTGAKKRSFGIQFPIDPRLEAMRDPGRRPRQVSPEGEPLPEDIGQGAVGILGSGKSGPKRVPMEEAGGIAARLAVHGDLLVYEMRIPLKGSQPGPYAVNAEPGSSLRLELQTPEWRGPMPIARGRIAIGAAGPGPGGRGMIGYPPIDGAVLKPMDATAIVRLATGAAR